MNQNKPILCLDFDGVCHSYTSGWKGADVIPDPPVPGLFEFLLEAEEQFEIHIFSTRSLQDGGIEAMVQWFDEWRQKLDKPLLRGLHFPIEKPPALVTLDDRAITFNGAWPQVDYLREFQPWYKRSKVGEESQDRLYQAAKWMLEYYEENGEEAFRRRHGSSPDVLDVCRNIISEGEGNPHPWPTSKPSNQEVKADGH